MPTQTLPWNGKVSEKMPLDEARLQTYRGGSHKKNKPKKTKKTFVPQIQHRHLMAQLNSKVTVCHIFFILCNEPLSLQLTEEF